MKIRRACEIVVELAAIGLAGCGGHVPRFAYVTNAGDNTVSIYTVDAVTGQLRARGYVATGTNPQSVAVDPSAKFAYVANGGSSNVSAYSINAATGALTSVGPAVAAGTFPLWVTVDPHGKFAYVANQNSNDVSAYSINATTGALTSLGPAVAAGTTPLSITVDPSGKFVYVANIDSNNVSGYSIDAVTGALTPLATYATVTARNGPVSLVVTRGKTAVKYTPKFAYVANNINLAGSVSAYTIDAATGALGPVAGSPFAAGGDPNSVAVDPSGKFAYVVNSTQATLPIGSVSAYIIDAASGALTPVAGSPFPAGTLSRSITVDPSGRFAYVANSMSNNVSAYTIDATSGALTAVTGSPFAAGTGPASVTVDPSGRFAYVANGDLGGSNNVSAYTIDAATWAL